ncbi:Protein NIF3-like protein [Colletotrichum sidae]|uniref:Protein NIF3-like protein n=2 Tax=Colletotrichum orbiculare species complex TaxID=2707354 RepID=N4VXL1_COLOR|nr:Protein NIF3-like protein [Colletotrichum orbiculare MAFF 240422]TEA18362.1 Protein NIF3-like protein [Colletotrichum sidae]
MAASSKYSSPSFTALVVDAMKKHYPEELADRRWDNVGLLLDNIETPNSRTPKSPVVLLTNDLTYAVAEEAVQKNASVIVSYHPFIFSGLKSITTKDPQQATLLLLASHGIAVYCPHTAADAAPNGLNAWLGDVVSGGPISSSSATPSERTVVTPISSAPAGFEGSGYGLLCTFRQPESLATVIRRVADKVGMRRVMVASPDPARVPTTRVNAVAVCAGSGWDVVKGAAADVIVTGETSHHNALKAVQEGKTIVTVFHSNSERGYLKEVMQPLLEGELKQKEAGVQVLVSETDRDPFDIIDISEL